MLKRIPKAIADGDDLDEITLYFVAEIVGSTVEDLAKRITLRELWGWQAYRKWKGEMERKAMDEARERG